MDGIKQLADGIDRSRIAAARRAAPVEKLLAGPRLFDRVRTTILAGVRSQFPAADESEVRRIVAERIAIGRRLENQRDE